MYNKQKTVPYSGTELLIYAIPNSNQGGTGMSKKQIRQIITDLTEKLCRKDFLEKSGLSKKNILMLMNKEHWEEQLIRLIPISHRFYIRVMYSSSFTTAICECPCYSNRSHCIQPVFILYAFSLYRAWHNRIYSCK